MPWLRIDDGFAEHYKLAELTDREFRVWVRTLCYAARNNGREGRLTASMRREIVGLTPSMVEKFRRLGLLDDGDEDGVLCVHDWPVYNPRDPSHADRQARYRRRKSDAASDGQSDADRDGESDGLRDGIGDAPRAGTRARPVPSPKEPLPTHPPELQDEVGGRDIDFGKILKDIPA